MGETLRGAAAAPERRGKAAGPGFREVGRVGEAAGLERAPTGARGDAGGGVRPGASPGTSLTPGALGKAGQAPPPAPPRSAARPRVERGRGAGDTPALQPPGKPNAQNVVDLLKVGDGFKDGLKLAGYLQE